MSGWSSVGHSWVEVLLGALLLGRVGWLLIFGRGALEFPSKSTLATTEPTFCEGAGVSQGTAAFSCPGTALTHCWRQLLSSLEGEWPSKCHPTLGVSPFFEGSECSLGTLLEGCFFLLRKPFRSKITLLDKFRCLAFPSNAFTGGLANQLRVVFDELDVRTFFETACR